VLVDAREAYDAFLERYPYCYGYWKKYADMEKQNGNYEIAEKVQVGAAVILFVCVFCVDKVSQLCAYFVFILGADFSGEELLKLHNIKAKYVATCIYHC